MPNGTTETVGSYVQNTHERFQEHTFGLEDSWETLEAVTSNPSWAEFAKEHGYVDARWSHYQDWLSGVARNPTDERIIELSARASNVWDYKDHISARFSNLPKFRTVTRASTPENHRNWSYAASLAASGLLDDQVQFQGDDGKTYDLKSDRLSTWTWNGSGFSSPVLASRVPVDLESVS